MKHVCKRNCKNNVIKKSNDSKKLAEKMSDFTGRKYTRQSVSNKISRSSLKYDEVEIIAKILDFKITIE